VPSEKSWTLFLDESGRFDAKERVALVVGGVLCPGARPDLDAKRHFRGACDAAGTPWPPHATELDVGVREGLLAAAARQVEAAGGRWLFVLSRPAYKAENALAAYLQMLGTLVDLAARLAALEGCQRLSVLPAQRTVPMSSNEEVWRAERLGLGRREGSFRDGEEIPFRAWVEGEVRQVFDALAREDQSALPALPMLEQVEVVAASGQQVDTGIVFADFACNATYRAISALEDGDLGAVASLLAVERNDAALVRRVDRRLRETPADLHGAARALATLAARARVADPGETALAREGSLEAARCLWARGQEALAQRVPEDRVGPVAYALAGAAFAALAAKTGAYEGTWMALEAAWAGDGPLAEKLRRGVKDRDLAARLWRCTLECANHRGDVVGAARAGEAFQRIHDAGGSLVLVAEQLAVRNFVAVAEQNRLPAPPDMAEEVRVGLLDSAEALRKAADEAGELVAFAGARLDRPAAAAPGEAELALWRAFGREPSEVPSDKERGRLIGTAARSLAFAGDLRRALEWALDARAYFDEPFDLRFNAAVLARILVEQARMGDHSRRPALTPVLALAGADFEPRAAAKALAADSAIRFAIDLVLRALLWAPDAVKGAARWLQAVGEPGKDGLHALLSELRSHPTELLARHAGEVVLQSGDEAGARQWFDLSLQLSAEAPPDSAIARFGEFTRLIAAGAVGVAAQPAGSIANPTFEYR
jgi:hypothetical protein